MKLFESLNKFNNKAFLNKNLGSPHRYTGFSLAEVLIALGIIGVVAGMTIPILIQNIQDAQLKTAFKKAYSIASQAWSQVVSENPGVYASRGGWSCTWADGTTADFNSIDGRPDAFKAKLKVVKSCINQAGCWPDNYEYDTVLAGSQGTLYNYSWITSDGMCWSSPARGLDDVHIDVDTNCNNKPNLNGKDIFPFMLGADGIIYFSAGDRSSTGKEVYSGLICPFVTEPLTINGRSVSFESMLIN